MIDYLAENATLGTSIHNPINLDFKMLDDTLTKSKKNRRKRKNHGKHKKLSKIKQGYAQLAFQYGVLSSRYDTLTRMVELSIAANRRKLNDQLLDDGLTALGRPQSHNFLEL